VVILLRFAWEIRGRVFLDISARSASPREKTVLRNPQADAIALPRE
jgi:hypothetical protein